MTNSCQVPPVGSAPTSFPCGNVFLSKRRRIENILILTIKENLSLHDLSEGLLIKQ